MSEREEEQPVITVKDRRRFNLDGSIREGLETEPEKPKEEAKPDLRMPEPLVGSEPGPIAEPAEGPVDLEEEIDPRDAENPASFINFLSTLATNAAAALGAMPHPVSGQRSVDLESGKYWLEVLAMLREKTKNNLNAQESRLLDGLLADLRMQYVQLVRAAEERLKQQAAKKFSSSDILGKK